MPRVEGSDYCWNHAPHLGQARAQARKRGGKATRTPAGNPRTGPVELGSLQAIQGELERVYAETLLQPNSPTRSRVCGYLLGFAIQLLAIGEHENRIAALEAALGPRRVA